MAKMSMINRELKRNQLVDKHAAKRSELRNKMKDPSLSMEEKVAVQVALQKLPRDSSPTRRHNRCNLTGRPHGVYRKFGLGRNKLREATMRGEVPGLRKGSW